MSPPHRTPPHERLGELAGLALETARKARRHRRPLGGANFYADKLAQLRTDAAASFSDLRRLRPAEEAGKLAALVAKCFSPATDSRSRVQAARDLRHELRVSWVAPAPDATPGEENAVFPLSLLSKRGYLASVGRQMNGCFVRGWYDACGVMMRRLLEIAIVEAFEHNGISGRSGRAIGMVSLCSPLVVCLA